MSKERRAQNWRKNSLRDRKAQGGFSAILRTLCRHFITLLKEMEIKTKTLIRIAVLICSFWGKIWKDTKIFLCNYLQTNEDQNFWAWFNQISQEPLGFTGLTWFLVSISCCIQFFIFFVNSNLIALCVCFFFTMYLGYCVYVSVAYPLSRLRQAAAVVGS